MSTEMSVTPNAVDELLEAAPTAVTPVPLAEATPATPEEELAELACRNAQLEEVLRESQRISNEFKVLSKDLDAELEAQKVERDKLRAENIRLQEANAELGYHLQAYQEEHEKHARQEELLAKLQERLEQLHQRLADRAESTCCSFSCGRSRRV